MFVEVGRRKYAKSKKVIISHLIFNAFWFLKNKSLFPSPLFFSNILPDFAFQNAHTMRTFFYECAAFILYIRFTKIKNFYM